MAVGRMARRVAALVVAGLVCGVGLADTGRAQGSDEFAGQRGEVNRLVNEEKYAEALAAQRALAAEIEKAETASNGRPGRKAAEAFGNLAWRALVAGVYVEALDASERAFALAPDLLWIETNRAHALLFTGRLDQARELYLAHKGRRLFHGSDETWEEAVAEDFDKLRRAGLPHAAFTDITDLLGLSGEIKALHKQVKQLYNEGKHAEALPVAEKYVALSRERFGDGVTEFARAINWLARLHGAQSRYAEAEPLYRQSLAIRERALGPEHPNVAESLNELALLYWRQRRYGEAEPLYKRSLAIREKALGPEHPDVGSSLNNLAVLHQDQGRYAEAEPLHKRSLAIREKAPGLVHRDVRTSLSNLAALYETQGRHAEAEPLYRRNLAIFEKELLSNHRDVRPSLNGLARLYRAQGRYAEAEPLLGRSLAITETALGPDHLDVGQSLSNLAGLYQDLGRYAEAEPLARRDLAIAEKVLGPDDHAVGASLNTLAQVYRKQGRYAEAEPLYRRGLAIAERTRPPEHPDVSVALHNLGQLYRDDGRYGEAEPLLERSLSLFEKALGPEHRTVSNMQQNLALLYEAQGRYGQAEPLGKRSLAIREKALGPEHPDVGSSLNTLATLYRKQGRTAEAESLGKRSLAIREKALGREHPAVGKSLDNLVELYKSQGRHAEAERLHRRSLAIREKALRPTVGSSLNDLAKQYESQYRWEEAEVLYRHSLAIREKVLGPEHPEVGTALSNLARLYEHRDRHAEAEPLYQRSVAIREKALGPEHRDMVATLNHLAEQSHREGRRVEAEVLYRRSLAIREKALGPEHPDAVQSLNTLVELYLRQARYREVESLAKRSLTVSEKLGEHPEVARALDNLARVHESQRRSDDAEPLRRRHVAILEKTLGPEHPVAGQSLYYLAGLYESQGRYREAEPLRRRNLAIREMTLGPDHPDVGVALENLAQLYNALGRTAEAEPLHKRSLVIRHKAAALKAEMVRVRDAGKLAEAAELAEQLLRIQEKSVLPPDRNDVAVAINDLAQLYGAQGRYADAEPLLRRSLAIVENWGGPDDFNVGVALNSLANLYEDQGRYAEAEPLLKRSIAIYEKARWPFATREKAREPKDFEVSIPLNTLAQVYRSQGRTDEAEALYKRSLAIREEALGPDDREVGGALNNLAGLYSEQGRYGEAEPMYRRSLGIFEKKLGPEHPHVGAALHNLARLLQDQGRYAEVEPMYRRSLGIVEKRLGPEHPDVGTALHNLGALAYLQSDWAGAADYWRRSTGVIKRRAERGLAGGRGRASGGEARRLAWPFWGLVTATHRLAAHGPGPTPALAAEMFETAQWMQGSEAAASLAQMAARSAKGSPQLAALVRERQDLVGEWQAKDKLLIAAKSEAPANRKSEAEKALADRLAAIDSRLAEIDSRFAQDFPDYAALASPAPVSVAEVQAQLSTDEALVLFLDMPERKSPQEKRKSFPEEAFAWVVTKSRVRWVRSDLGAAALAREVTALRCGLDATAWDGEEGEKCSKILGIPPDKVPGPDQTLLPFDQARSHKLYSALFGEMQDLIKGKHLLIVPSGPLTQLPFQVLVTKPPASGDHRAVAWLARGHAVTVLPAVSSLKALRRVGKPSTAPRPMIGIGNPLLDGPDASHAARATLAREKQRCPEARGTRLAALAGLRGGVARVETRGGLADVSHIKGQTPLPETADELCAVAQDVKAAATDVRLGAQATEREVKRLSASGELAKYRMVHFATHGVLAGQLDGANEPGLILTPPDKATDEDDGYLSASEIAGLKLDADWVILSACNTAAGAATSAEALSGLAQAFIYAQARALLVSHWAVYSDATVKLVTAAVREMARDAKAGRAEALRRSMLALIDRGEPQEAHPAFWAPFVVVGAGADVQASPAASGKARASKAVPKEADDWRQRLFDQQ